jgi:hypothetical protein
MRSLEQKELPKKGSRHPLSIYLRLNEVTFWPCLLIMASCTALLIWNPVEFESYRLNLSVILAGTALILVLTFLMRLKAYVQCRETELQVQLPFYRMSIPYAEIRNTRPTELFRLFPPKKQARLNRHYLEGLLGKTVLVLELKALPQSESWLRLWASKYMICPDQVGLVIGVRDWIAFRTEFDDFRTRARQYHY